MKEVTRSDILIEYLKMEDNVLSGMNQLAPVDNLLYYFVCVDGNDEIVTYSKPYTSMKMLVNNHKLVIDDKTAKWSILSTEHCHKDMT